ncbi:MAG: hypothetical protein QM731_01325 [Chitinophagaceae bacterium]
MKKLLLSSLLLAVGRLLSAQTTLISKNFEFNSVRYEYQLNRTDDKHVQFSICTATTPATCKTSKAYLNDFDKTLYDPEFKSFMMALDSTLGSFLAATAANQTAFDKLKDDLYNQSLEKIKEKTPQQKTIEDLQGRLKEVLADNSSEEVIGALVMPEQTINVYNKKEQVVRTTTIKQVEVTIGRGSIMRRGLKITLDDGGVYFNRQAPISFASFFRRKADRMVRFDSRLDSAFYVQLGDILDYSFRGTINYPADGYHILTKEKRVDSLRIGSALNNLIEMTVYTDLLGLLGRKANGLLQSEVSGNFITNTGSIKNSDIVFHNFIRPYIRLSKFDSRFTSLDSSNIQPGPGKKDTVNRTYLNQISYLQGGIKMNLVHFGIGINQAINLNIGADINLVSTDSLYKKDIIFFNFYPEFNYTVNRVKNFGMDVSLKFLRQHIAENVNISNSGSIWIFNPNITLCYYVSSKEENKVYFRFNYFDNLHEGKYNFTQFQLGYKTSLKIN